MHISCCDLDIEFGTETYLKNVQFTVPPNSITLLYGPSGSGKTTLFNILSGLIPVPGGKGNVFWGDCRLRSPVEANRHRNKYLSLILSTFYFLESIDVESNIVLPAVLDKQDSAVIDEKLQKLYQIFSFEGKQKELNLVSLRRRPVSLLSNGQKELVGIARAFMLDSPFIFADEMLRSFNQEGEAALWERIVEDEWLGIGKRRGMFMITHKEHLKNDKRIGRVFCIDNRRIVEC